MSETLTTEPEIKWPDPELELILRKPVETPDGGTLTKVMLREPTSWEWELIMAQPVATRRRYSVSLIGGVPMKAVAAMGIGDIARGEAYLVSFYAVALAAPIFGMDWAGRGLTALAEDT